MILEGQKMKAILRAFKFQVTVVTIFLLLASLTPNCGTAASIFYPMFHKGMNYVTWSDNGFASFASDKSIRSMSQIGVKCVAIVPTWYQEHFDSIKMEKNTRTPSDQSLKRAIRKAREEGMFVMLKPHIDLISDEGNTRSDIGFYSDDKWKEWFDNYTRFIVHYAKIAQSEDVEFFCIGTELSFAAAQTRMWKDEVIPKVRKVFKGQITYAANWDEYANIEFWDALDYAGIDAYFPLAEKGIPDYEGLKQGWRKWIEDIEEWVAKVKKPVLFTECGYASVNTAAVKPWQENRRSKPNPELQANCYKALMEELWDKEWFFGVYWWNWNTYSGSGGTNNRGFTPQNKPAAECIEEWFKKDIEKNHVVKEESAIPPSERSKTT